MFYVVLGEGNGDGAPMATVFDTLDRAKPSVVFAKLEMDDLFKFVQANSGHTFRFAQTVREIPNFQEVS